MEQELLHEFERLYQNQETIAEIATKGLYGSLGNTDTHCISCIGAAGAANGVQLAAMLGLTRSAVSKITTRLEMKDYILGSKRANNNKEIFYTLTEKGREIFAKHENAHAAWLARDEEFFKTVSESDKEVLLRVLRGFNNYILERMEEYKNDN